MKNTLAVSHDILTTGGDLETIRPWWRALLGEIVLVIGDPSRPPGPTIRPSHNQGPSVHLTGCPLRTQTEPNVLRLALTWSLCSSGERGRDPGDCHAE